MDNRKELAPGQVLCFPGMQCHIEKTLGRGSNAIVYKAWYRDQLHRQEKHHVLIKELFPHHPDGEIWRDEQGCICVQGEEALAHFQLHQESFEAGNRIHLKLLENAPESLGGNLNSYEHNGTLYTILSHSGGRSLKEELDAPSSRHDLRWYARLMLKLMDALEAFHESGYLHLDVSPDNMLLLGKAGDERVLLIDYNSARRTDADASALLSCKEGYSAPELEMGDHESICEASDLYSAAAVFYRCLMGRPPLLEEVLQSSPPDAHESPCLQEEPQTVQWQVRTILRNSLRAAAEDRYAQIAAMRKDLLELLDRIDCVGVTHWALWEAGKRSVDELIRVNSALRYVKNEEETYPIRVEYDGQSQELPAFLGMLLSESGASMLTVSQGGMGKTTLLLKTALFQNRRYAANRTAAFYVTLGGWRTGDAHYIRNQILTYLHFKRESAQSAMHELEMLFNRPLRTREGKAPSVLLLLDGLNEVQGDVQPLLEEIRLLDRMQGVRILAASRSDVPELGMPGCALVPLAFEDVEKAAQAKGVLLPQNKTLLYLLKTPLVLSIYLKASENRQQLYIQDQNGLMQAYLEALRDKEVSGMPENAPERWRIDAAIRYVLPALAARADKTGGTMNNQQMLEVVQECYGVLSSRMLQKAFPEWIGRSRDILGGMKTADEWFALIIHDLLWQRLGLLVKDGQDRWRIFHQMIGDHLAPRHRENARRIQKKKMLQWSFWSAPILLAAAVAVWVYMACFMITPYDDTEAEIAISQGLMIRNGYVHAFERMQELMAIVQGEDDPLALSKYGARAENLGWVTMMIRKRDMDPFENKYEEVMKALDDALRDPEQEKRRLEDLGRLAAMERKVVSWSGLPLDADGMMAFYGFLWERITFYQTAFLPELRSWYYGSGIARKADQLALKGTTEYICFDTAVEMLLMDFRTVEMMADAYFTPHTGYGPLKDQGSSHLQIRKSLLAHMEDNHKWEADELAVVEKGALEARGGWQRIGEMQRAERKNAVNRMASIWTEEDDAPEGIVSDRAQELREQYEEGRNIGLV